MAVPTIEDTRVALPPVIEDTQLAPALVIEDKATEGEAVRFFNFQERRSGESSGQGMTAPSSPRLLQPHRP